MYVHITHITIMLYSLVYNKNKRYHAYTFMKKRFREMSLWVQIQKYRCLPNLRNYLNFFT